MSDIVYALVPEFPFYRAGTDGSIWTSLIRRTRRQTTPLEWRQMAPAKRNGYLAVLVSPTIGKRKYINVNVLVLMAFVGPRPDGLHCRHLDGDKLNNKLTNIAWGTVQENHDDKQRHGTTARGERHGQSKLTEEKVRRIKQMIRDGIPIAHIAKHFSAGETTIAHIRDGDTWGYVT